MDLKKAMNWMSAGFKAQLIKEAHDTGEPLAKVVADHSMPDIAILDDDLTFDYEGKRVTVEEWENLNPLGRYGKIVVHGTPDQLERLKIKQVH